MKLNINIPATPKRTRILAAFMAFLIFALTFQEVFVGWDSMRAKAVQITEVTKTGDYQRKYTVASTTHAGHSVVKNSGGENTDYTLNYRYTGTIKSTKVSLYDYLTDNEIAGNAISNNYTNYGSEPFNTFNTAISNTVKATAESQNQNNITITFENTLNWSSV